MSGNKNVLYVCVSIISILFIILAFIFLTDYYSKKIELEKYKINQYLKETKQSIEESHIFYVPEKHQIIINLPDWADIILDANQKDVNMDERIDK